MQTGWKNAQELHIFPCCCSFLLELIILRLWKIKNKQCGDTLAKIHSKYLIWRLTSALVFCWESICEQLNHKQPSAPPSLKHSDYIKKKRASLLINKWSPAKLSLVLQTHSWEQKKKAGTAVLLLTFRIKKGEKRGGRDKAITTKLHFTMCHQREGHMVTAALHQRGAWHKSREFHDENQRWPCQRWQFSGKRSIKARSTCHLFFSFSLQTVGQHRGFWLPCFFRTGVMLHVHSSTLITLKRLFLDCWSQSAPAIC